MKLSQLQLDFLRDEAIKHLPRCQKTMLGRAPTKDMLCSWLCGDTIHTLADPKASALEQSAAHVLQPLMRLQINWDEKLTASQRRIMTAVAVNATHEHYSLLGIAPPSWLPAAMQEPELEQEEELLPPKEKPQPQQHVLPSQGINLTTADASRLLNRKPQTLRAWASKETGPIQPIRGGTGLIWRSDDVLRIMKDGWK